MNRIGVQPNVAIDFIKKVQNAEYLELQGIFTHYYEAESIEETEKQTKIWNDIISSIDTKNLLLHIQNTAGTLCYDISTSNMLRIGIGLYGMEPDYPTKEFRKPNLKPVMSIKGRIVHIHEAKGGVSYCHTYKIKDTIKVATVPLGYADGISRGLSNKIFAEINGKKVNQIGNITMDQMMFNITDANAKVGDVITLIGENAMSFDDWAKILNTINYELTCRMKVRLPRVYTR